MQAPNLAHSATHKLSAQTPSAQQAKTQAGKQTQTQTVLTGCARLAADIGAARPAGADAASLGPPPLPIPPAPTPIPAIEPVAAALEAAETEVAEAPVGTGDDDGEECELHTESQPRQSMRCTSHQTPPLSANKLDAQRIEDEWQNSNQT